MLRLRSTEPRGRRAERPRVPGAVRLHAALRHEGEPEPRHPARVPRSRPARRRVQRPRGRARAARRRPAGEDPADVADAVATARRVRRPRRALQRVLAAPARRASARSFPGREVTVRVNPGPRAAAPRTAPTPAGPAPASASGTSSSTRRMALAARHRVTIRGLHTHIGSGTDPAVWKRVARMSLDIAARLPDVTTLNLGGGFKVARVPEERATDLPDIGAHVRAGAARLPRAHGPLAAPGGRARDVPRRQRRLRGRHLHRRRRHRRRRLSLRQARHRHDRDHPPVALRRAASDHGARRARARAPSSSSDRAASPATSSRPRRAIPRRSRRGWCRSPRSATWS